jgi:hypothetical protein
MLSESFGALKDEIGPFSTEMYPHPTIPGAQLATMGAVDPTCRQPSRETPTGRFSSNVRFTSKAMSLPATLRL